MSETWGTISAAIQAIFQTGWGSASSVAYPDQPYTPTAGTNWVRLTVKPGASEQKTMAAPGRRMWRQYGVLMLQIFTPIHHGDAGVLSLVETAAAIFRGKTIGAIQFMAPSFAYPGSSGGWNQANVTVPFKWDEFF